MAVEAPGLRFGPCPETAKMAHFGAPNLKPDPEGPMVPYFLCVRWWLENFDHDLERLKVEKQQTLGTEVTWRMNL